MTSLSLYWFECRIIRHCITRLERSKTWLIDDYYKTFKSFPLPTEVRISFKAAYIGWDHFQSRVSLPRHESGSIKLRCICLELIYISSSLILLLFSCSVFYYNTFDLLIYQSYFCDFLECASGCPLINFFYCFLALSKSRLDPIKIHFKTSGFIRILENLEFHG